MIFWERMNLVLRVEGRDEEDPDLSLDEDEAESAIVYADALGVSAERSTLCSHCLGGTDENGIGGGIRFEE